MKPQFDLVPTEEEIAFARMRHLKNLEFIRTQPFILLTFSEFWNQTFGGTVKVDHAEVLHDIVNNYRSTAILMNGSSKDEVLWRGAVLRNREWVQSLSDEDKQELQKFDTYGNWHIGLLSCDPITINGALKLFPNLAGGDQTPEIIWKYENPESPDRLPGAVDIDTHDSIHCLLGRGGLQADEAFVIGFTMGGASDELTPKDIAVFIEAITTEYPKPYNIDPKYVPSYLIGVAAGKEHFRQTGIDLSKVDFTPYRDLPLHQVRAKFKIDENLLSEIYNKFEAEMIPNKKPSQRNSGYIDPSRISGRSPRLSNNKIRYKKSGL